MAEIVLYDYWRSSASYRLRIALNLAEIDYRLEPVDLLKGEHRSPDHLARNPQGFVPVLEIDGHRFTQSLAILTYLDRMHGLGLLPDDPVERAKVEALAHAVAVDLHPVCNLRVAKHAVEIAGDPDARAAWMQHFIRPGMVAFEALLSSFPGGPFSVGDRPMLPDICLMPQIYNARRWGAEISDLPGVTAAAAACDAHPAFAAAHPDTCRPEG